MELLARIFDWLREQEAGFSAVAAILVIAGVVFAGFRWLVSRRSQPSLAPTAEAAKEEDPLLALPTGPVVAVLPFENLSRDPDQEYFSDGLTDDIITALSRFKDLFVIARNSTFRYKGHAVDVRQLNKELGARYVLEGSVQRAESRLRVTAQLLDAKDGTHLWAETYDRDLSVGSIFEVQDAVTERVVATIAGRYGVISRAQFAEIREKPTESLDSYECVLHYTAYASDKLAPVEHAKVRDALERAVTDDPNYAEAWACLCLVYLDEHRYGFNPRPDPLDRALEAARRAVDLDPSSQTARGALAGTHFFRHQLDRFKAEAERALALNPNHSVVLASVGTALSYAGDERGIALVRKAMELDPFHPTAFNTVIAEHHFEKGEYEEALLAARKVDQPGHFYIPAVLAAIYAELGREKEARSALEDLVKLWPDLTAGQWIEQLGKWNYPDQRIEHMVSALRKAGLPE